MDWSNDTVLEFIHLVQNEPSIWNHRAKDHKNRAVVRAAWKRIQNNFSLSYPLEDLKRKRSILLAQYREIIRKIKESQQTATEPDELYKPSWFAFDTMHGCLKDLYDQPSKPPSVKAETEELQEFIVTYEDDPLSNESDNGLPCELPGINSNNKRSITPNSRPNSRTRALSRDSNTPSEPDSRVYKKQRRLQDKTVQQDTFPDKRPCKETDTVRECDLYGQLLAEKLKPLEQDERLQLMNDIDNLVFKFLMRMRKQKTPFPGASKSFNR